MELTAERGTDLSYGPLFLRCTFRKSGPWKSGGTNSLKTCGGGFVSNTRGTCDVCGEAHSRGPSREPDVKKEKADTLQVLHFASTSLLRLGCSQPTKSMLGVHTPRYSLMQDAPEGNLCSELRSRQAAPLCFMHPKAPLTHIPSLSALLS